MATSSVSSRYLLRFVEMLSAEVGVHNLPVVLEKSSLPSDWIDVAYLSKLDGERASEAYAGLQSAMRTYYGRSARGTLLRVGAKLWERMLSDADLGVKGQAALVRGLPNGMRHKPALDLLARLLSTKQGDVTVHTLDLDLLLVDHASPSTLGQKDSAPVCFVTQGLIREALFWAVGQEHDIDEISCRANGSVDCEFKITIGGGK